jgi:2-isopropylmalate synthase
MDTKTENRTIKIFDTTLRDGEQSPGCSMNLKEKIEMAKQLERMRVDIIEAGFAISSPGDFTSVKTIAETVKDCTVASLARAAEKDIDRAWDAVRSAADPRIHIFLATSPLHMKYKLLMEPEDVYERAVAMTAYAAHYCPNVEFSAEDATRSDPVFLARVIEGVIAAGATTINLPDTVGYTMPDEHYAFFTRIRDMAPSLETVTLSAHCHNDLGLGVANSLAAIRAGVGQVECTINGIGERAGNAAMEEIVMALYTRKDLHRAGTRIVTTEILHSSNLLTRITGVKVQPNKAVVGENAFAHEAGIHQHGVMQHRGTYEIMTPESVGLNKNNLVLGKHSGKHAFRDRVKSLGYDLNDAELEIAFEKFKALADKKKTVYDRDIEALVAKEAVQVPRTYRLDNFVINSGNAITSTAVIRMTRADKILEKVSRGEGPIDAAFKAIEKIVGRSMALEDYQLGSVTEGGDALGDALVKIKNENGESFSGRGLSTDVIEASIHAYVNAVNKMIHAEKEGLTGARIETI